MIGIVSTPANAASAPATRTPATIAKPIAQDPPAPPPSVIVTLSGANAPDPAPTYPAPGLPTPSWEFQSQDAVSTRMAGNFSAASVAGRFAGLGKSVLDRFATGSADFSQSVSTVGIPGFGSGAQGDTSLTIRTASGATVTVSLASSADGLSVKLQSSATLSDAERAAVAKLSGAFQDAIDGMAAVPPKLDLGGLTGFDTSVLASVDFTAQTVTGKQPPQTIAFHADNQTRSVKTSGAIGTIDVSVDMSSPGILGNAAQRAAAIDSYLQQVDQAASRGKGDAALVAMFKDAFTQMTSVNDTGTSLLLKSPPRIALSDADHSMLTGLGDFHASMTAATSAPNPLRPGEKDAFTYELSQETQVSGKDSLNRGISQHVHSQLSASFHQALSPDVSLMLTDKPTSQNYYYTQIDDSADSQTDIAYTKGELTQASISRTASQSTHQSKYVMNQLVEDSTLPEKQSSSRDLLGLLKSFEDDKSAPTRQRQAEWQQTLSAVHAGVGLESDPSRLRSAAA